MRHPTDLELDILRHEAVSLAVRGGRRLWALRVASPADVDRDVLVTRLRTALATTPVGTVEVLCVEGDAVRVLGGVFSG